MQQVLSIFRGFYESLIIDKRELKFITITIAIWIIVLNMYTSDVNALLAEYWPIVFIALISAAFANATAIGGGFIFLPLFSLFYGLAPILSLKLALATQAFGMSSGSLSWPKELILWRYVFYACIGGGVGMVLGTFFFIPTDTNIHFFFGCVSLCLGFIFLKNIFPSKKMVNKEIRAIGTMQLCGYLLLCLVGGLINAWVSIAIGEVVALWLILVLREDVAKSIATGVVALAFCSILGLLFHSALGGISWDYLLFTAPGVILGGRLGAKMGYKLSTMSVYIKKIQINPLKLFVALVIIVDGVFMLSRHPNV